MSKSRRVGDAHNENKEGVTDKLNDISDKFRHFVEEDNRKEENLALQMFFDKVCVEDQINTNILFGGQLDILKLILKGDEIFSDELKSFWQNTGVVAALIGDFLSI